METVRAKVRCNSVTDYGGQKAVNLSAVYGKEGQNADYAKATPSLDLTMNIDAETKAADYFKPGKFYYLDFLPAPEK